RTLPGPESRSGHRRAVLGRHLGATAPKPSPPPRQRIVKVDRRVLFLPIAHRLGNAARAPEQAQLGRALVKVGRSEPTALMRLRPQDDGGVPKAHLTCAR